MPSEKILEQKKQIVVDLTESLNAACAGVVVEYKGINVEDDTKLRKELREAGVIYTVEKNSILRFAFKEVGMDFDSVLEGTTAIALCADDQTAPARILGKYADGSDGKFSVKAGFVDGEIYDAAGIMALSKIPSKEVLLSMLIGSLQAPMQKLAATLQSLVDKKNEEAA